MSLPIRYRHQRGHYPRPRIARRRAIAGTEVGGDIATTPIELAESALKAAGDKVRVAGSAGKARARARQTRLGGLGGRARRAGSAGGLLEHRSVRRLRKNDRLGDPIDSARWS